VKKTKGVKKMTNENEKWLNQFRVGTETFKELKRDAADERRMDALYRFVKEKDAELDAAEAEFRPALQKFLQKAMATNAKERDTSVWLVMRLALREMFSPEIVYRHLNWLEDDIRELMQDIEDGHRRKSWCDTASDRDDADDDGDGDDDQGGQS
jgi:hypothetical protein